MPEILVTGATGFIGRHLVERLRRDGTAFATLARADGDVTQAETWAAAPDSEVVVHLAARSFVPDSWSNPAEVLHTNLCGTAQALSFCRERGARMIFASSYLYGRPRAIPIAEDAPLQALNPYALSKKLGEETCRFFAETFDVPVTILRPFNVYGPGQGGHFLIPEIVGKIRRSQPIELKDLEPRRDYVHVNDLVGAIMRASKPCSGTRTFNIGSGSSHSVAEVIAMLQNIAGTCLEVIDSGVRRPNEVMDVAADISAAREQLDWTPRIALRDGLAAMWDECDSDVPEESA